MTKNYLVKCSIGRDSFFRSDPLSVIFTVMIKTEIENTTSLSSSVQTQYSLGSILTVGHFRTLVPMGMPILIRFPFVPEGPHSTCFD
jgi:hypothetical protein